MNAAPWPDLPGAKVEDRIEIKAGADQIWALLENVNDWGAWNPLYETASGTIRVGETINFAVVLPGMKPQKAHATILQADQNARLIYQTVSLGGLLVATRYVGIVQSSPQLCTVSNGEVMSGFVGRLLAPALGPKVLAAIKLMNVALKEKAESAAAV